jgi:HAMP domain-containing protein
LDSCKHPNRDRRRAIARLLATSMRPYRAFWFACLVLIPAFAGRAQSPTSPISPLRMDKVDLPTPINQAPDPNVQMQMHDQQTRQQGFAAANAERKKQISDDSARLLKLAGDLKSEVDKTNKDNLSLNVIRKADEIEKLAHSVREKMKLTVVPTPRGGN